MNGMPANRQNARLPRLPGVRLPIRISRVLRLDKTVSGVSWVRGIIAAMRSSRPRGRAAAPPRIQPGRSFMVLLAAMLAASALTACNGRSERCARTDLAPESPPKKQISVLLQSKQGDYWKTVLMGAEAAAKEFGVELTVMASESDGGASAETATPAAASAPPGKKADAIVLAAGGDQALARIAERASGTGVPVIAVESEAESVKPRSFIGSNNYEAGRQAGKKLLELIGGSGRVAILSFGPGANNAEQRERGVMDELSGHPGVELAAKESCGAGLQPCGEAARKVLAQTEGLAGIVALNAEASLSAAAELLRLGSDGKVKLVAEGSAQEELDLLQDGVIHATIIQNPFAMGYLGVKYAVDAADGRKVPERFDTGTKVIDRESMFWSDNQKLLFPFVK
ncbi:substrate-binding domain-containing protein [Paenibacillus hamazuiensis]|uniref:substrate-binding domain-containing protein n=1 Tax=Paenibacillus hamazuiensis TaxID=2936508 RepID=UPI00200C60A5|nr:substrate-binding domain-containing protein [Paenibacillus hamazuiensis]